MLTSVTNISNIFHTASSALDSKLSIAVTRCLHCHWTFGAYCEFFVMQHICSLCDKLHCCNVNTDACMCDSFVNQGSVLLLNCSSDLTAATTHISEAFFRMLLQVTKQLLIFCVSLYW